MTISRIDQAGPGEQRGQRLAKFLRDYFYGTVFTGEDFWDGMAKAALAELERKGEDA